MNNECEPLGVLRPKRTHFIHDVKYSCELVFVLVAVPVVAVAQEYLPLDLLSPSFLGFAGKKKKDNSC